MSTGAIYLRKWLNRSDQPTETNLKFGIKAWQSIEFVCITKYQIITEEFCKNIPKLRKEILKKADNPIEYDKFWLEIINEFLGLKCSSGAVNSLTKQKLLLTLETEVMEILKTKLNPNVHDEILDGLLLTFHNVAMQNYYKSYPDAYATFIATIFKLINRLLSVNGLNNESWLVKQIEKIKLIVKALKLFVKQTPLIEEFRKSFSNEVIVPFSELMICLKSKYRQYDFSNDYFQIIQQLYFTTNNTMLSTFLTEHKQITTKTPKRKIIETDYFQLLLIGENIPLYCTSLVFEVIILSYRHDPDILSSFLQYLFEKFYNENHITSLNNHHRLDNVSYVLNLLRKYDVNLNFEINNEKAIKYIGKYVEQLTDKLYETNLTEVIALTISTLKLNPMMLEHTIIGIVVNFMVARKDDRTLRIYEVCMVAVLDVYRRLSRLEKFISQLIRSLWEKLATMKLTKKIRKRKSILAKDDDELVEGVSGTPARKKSKLIMDSGGDDDAVNSTDHLQEYSLSILKLLYNLINTTTTPTTTNKNQCEINNLWCEISFAWPSGIGSAFIKSISALVSKPSMVVWKTLLFTLSDYINLLKDGNSDENTLFLIELTSTLLCQYFLGTRLAEQADKQWPQITINCQTTHQILHDFGTIILNQPHNIRTMNSFLKLCIHFGEFNLLLWYYCPDSIITNKNDDEQINFQKSAQSIHSYLHAKEWTLIEQRITNFGKNECKININKLYLQRFKASLLFDSSSSSPEINNQSFRSAVSMIKNIEDDSAVQLLEILKSHETADLFIEHLTINEKLNIAEIILKNYQIIDGKLLKNILQNLEFAQVLFIVTIKRLAENFSPNKSIFKSFDFDEIFNCGGGGENIPIHLNQLSEIIKKWCQQQQEEQHQQKNISIKKYSKDLLEENLSILELINVDFADQNWKNLIFLLHLMLFCNLKATGEISLKNRSINLIKEFLHFGIMPNIFKYISITELSLMLPLSLDNTSHNSNDDDKIVNELSLAKDIYGIIFDKSTKHLNNEQINMFNELQKLLETNDSKFINIGFLLVQYLIKEKRCKQYYNQFRNIILKKIREYFEMSNRSVKDDELFVEQTIDVFCTVIATTLAKVDTDGGSVVDDVASDIDFLKNVWKIYLNYSTNINNLCSIKLLNLTIIHKIVLNITDDEIKTIIDKHWTDFNQQLKSNTESSETLELFLKIVLNHKTSEEFIDLLTENDESQDLIMGFKSYQYKLFSYVAKCQLNKVKGSIFNEFFRQISLRLVMSLRCKSIITNTPSNSTNTITSDVDTVKSITEIPSNLEVILKLLECQRLICSNTQIPMTVNAVDDILSFLSEINIKKWEIIDGDGESTKIFVDIHTKMCEIMFILIQNRHFFIADRIVQYVGIFRDLIQAVCCYKSNITGAAVASAIDGAELSKLTELAHKLENIIKSLVKFNKNVKRIAPYLLLFIINLVITNDRSTTLFPKIKTHFDAICYDLIAVSDHRVEGFILRNCNEASKQTYEQLIKEYNKYHKFKGKV